MALLAEAAAFTADAASAAQLYPLLEPWGDLNAVDQAGTYSTLVKAAYPAAKAGNADVPVLAGAMSSTDQAFLAAMYANGVKGYYDGISVHPYADPGFVKLAAFRAVQQAAGDNTPIWATEFGWPTGTNTGWRCRRRSP